MFNIQPGQGLSGTVSKQIAFGLGSRFIAEIFEYILRMLVGDQWVRTAWRFLNEDGLYDVLPVHFLKGSSWQKITQTYPKLHILVDGVFEKSIAFYLTGNEFKPVKLSYKDETDNLQYIE